MFLKLRRILCTIFLIVFIGGFTSLSAQYVLNESGKTTLDQTNKKGKGLIRTYHYRVIKNDPSLVPDFTFNFGLSYYFRGLYKSDPITNADAEIAGSSFLNGSLFLNGKLEFQFKKVRITLEGRHDYFSLINQLDGIRTKSFSPHKDQLYSEKINTPDGLTSFEWENMMTRNGFMGNGASVGLSFPVTDYTKIRPRRLKFEPKRRRTYFFFPMYIYNMIDGNYFKSDETISKKVNKKWMLDIGFEKESAIERMWPQMFTNQENFHNSYEEDETYGNLIYPLRKYSIVRPYIGFNLTKKSGIFYLVDYKKEYLKKRKDKTYTYSQLKADYSKFKLGAHLMFNGWSEYEYTDAFNNLNLQENNLPVGGRLIFQYDMFSDSWLYITYNGEIGVFPGKHDFSSGVYFRSELRFGFAKQKVSRKYLKKKELSPEDIENINTGKFIKEKKTKIKTYQRKEGKGKYKLDGKEKMYHFKPERKSKKIESKYKRQRRKSQKSNRKSRFK